MTSYSMTCTSGHTQTLEADSRDDAVAMFKAGTTEEAIGEHMRQNHDPGEPAPSVAQVHGMIEQTVTAAA